MRISTPICSRFAFGLVAAAILTLNVLPKAYAVEAPNIVQKDGRYALMVEGPPVLDPGRTNSQFKRLAQRTSSGMAVDGRLTCQYGGSSCLLGAV